MYKTEKDSWGTPLLGAIAAFHGSSLASHLIHTARASAIYEICK